MSNETENNDQKSRRKWPWIVLLCIAGVIGLVRVALMTGPVHRWVKGIIVDTANNQLRPQLSIGDLSGDLWSDVTLTDVVLTQDQDSTVASLDTLHLGYSPLSYFSDAFQIHQFRLIEPFIKIRQEEDSTLNVQNWMVPSEDPDTTSSTFAFIVSDLSIKQGRFDVDMPQLEPESVFLIDDFNLGSSIGYYGDQYEASVEDFNFKIKNTRFDRPVSFNAAADADEQSISLEKLVIATGNSMLEASGRGSWADSTADFKAGAKPLNWRDLAAYADSMPVKKDIRLGLNMSGNAEQFDVSLDAEAEGIEQFSMSGRFQADSALTLTAFEASAGRLDLETFMSDTAMPRLQNLAFKTQGRVSLQQYEQGQLEGTLSAANIRQGTYRLDRLDGDFALKNGNADLTLQPSVEGEKITLAANASRIWGEKPSVALSVRGTNIDPAAWMQDTTYAGSLTFNGAVSGSGWYPQEDFWDYRLTINKSRVMDQQVDGANFSGRLSQNALTNTSDIRLDESRLNLKADVRELQSTPAFLYTLDAKNVNLAAFNGLQDYPSSITGRAQGEGRGSSLGNLQMQTTIQTDSSRIIGETIQNLTLDARLDNSMLTIDRGGLKSTIADADYSGQVYLSDYYDTGNNLSLNIQLKDLSSFASVAGVEILQATGSIEGQLKPTAQDSLIFDGRVDLENVNYNNQFVAPQIGGGVRLDVNQQPQYVLDFDITEPTVGGTPMQNISINTEGAYTDSVTAGKFEFTIAGTRKGRIFQAGSYRVGSDSTSVELNEFDLTSSLRTLSLTKPFHARYADGALQTDTMRIISKDSTAAFLELAVPYADTLRQQAHARLKNLDLTAIQNTVLENPILEGKVFGDISLARTDTSLNASGDVILSDMVYQQTKLDTLRLKADIKDERLTGSMELHQDGKRIAEGDADIPFRMGMQGEPDNAFFEKPVSGELKLNAVELSRFNTLLEQAGYENTQGILRFDGKLDGDAGNPRFDASLSLSKAKLSGVPVDSLVTSVKYTHEASQLDINASLTSLKQKALEAEARMPLEVDLSTFDMAFPGPQDSVSVAVQTNNFNLKALNDFLDPQTARNLAGRINGKVDISGPRSDLQTKGEFVLSKGAVRVVPAGIRLDHIESTIRFKPDEIELQQLRMESGSGDLSAKGTLALQQLVPGDIALSVKAENFKAANTDEYNALVNLDMKMGGSVTKPEVSGTLQMINGFLELDNFGEKSVEQIELDTTQTSEPQISLYDSLSLDMDIEFNRRFFVRNQRYLEMEIELEGQLDILKDSGKDLELFGTLNTARGYARPLGKRFELEEGSLAFSGPPANPQLNIRTLYEPPQADQEIKIWYTIEGTVEDPQFKYESSPQMDLAGIISYTLFGQPFYKLNSAEQSVASSSSNNAAADFAMDVLLDRVESIATRKLGIDVVRIEQTRVGGDSGTSITTGWYINPKVFFAIQNVITGSTPSTGFYLEYFLKENLKLILSQAPDNRQGVDVQWEYDY
jgi:autotransporter translocation and assembly factor TamB